MNCKVYLELGDLNDATSYYLSIIEQALARKGYSIDRVDNVAQIASKDLVLVIQAKAFYKVWRKNKNQRIIIWFQGIIPEEAKMLFPNPIQYIPRSLLWRYLERIALKHSEFNLFVSESMMEHYIKKYGYNSHNYFIMPCFNMEICKDSFYVEGKYNKPTFVYAGNLAAWQCAEQTIAAYVRIEKSIPNSNLTMLTNDKNKATKLLEKYGAKNFSIKYVQQSELNKELSKYKYGFLLREDTLVNNVATPTKMNSYMSAGIIPVYSAVIGDFKKVFCESKNIVTIEDINNVDQICNEIIKTESLEIQPDNVYADFEMFFQDYYNSNKYIKLLQSKLN